MKLTQADLERAADQQLLSRSQVAPLWDFLSARSQNEPRFELGHVIYYFGALLILTAMTWFFRETWEQFGGRGVFFTALAYGVFFTLAGRWIWQKLGYRIPGGLLLTIAVFMVPLAIYGFQRMIGVWPEYSVEDRVNVIRWQWFYMEMGTILAGFVYLRFFRFPFLTFPVALALWYMAVDCSPYLFGLERLTERQTSLISVVVGGLMLLASYLADRKTKEDFSFWGYFFGMTAFWGGLTSMDSDSEMGKLIYCLLNVGFIFLSVFLNRKVFIVFGAAGVCVYFSHIAHTLFKDSLLFPFALSAFGLAIIFLGIWYQKNRARVEAKVDSLLPESVKRLRPVSRV